jgi:hypothetical protein
VGLGEVVDLRALHHGAVVVREFADDADRGQAGEAAEIDRGLGVPDRISTPPSLAMSGKTWPGRTKSDAPMLWFASARTVFERCSAEMPVVRP